jgi:DNA-directed RNA polymerase specialized sigma24 family protein
MSEAKDYLLKIRLYDARIENGLQELSALEDMVTRITPVLKQDMVSGSHSQDKLGDTVAKIADLRDQINRDVDAFVDLKKEAAVKLAQVKNPDYYKVLHLRYIRNFTFERIAIEMNYSYRGVCYLHGRALQAFEKVMEKEKEA